MAQTTSLVFNGGVIPSPSPVPAGSGKAKLLKIGEITVTEQAVQVTKKVICDPDSITTVAPFMEVLTSAKLAELISANSILVLDDGTVQYLMADATVVVEDGTSVCTSVSFLGLSLGNRAKVLYPCTRITDELTLQQVLEVGEPVETNFDFVKAYPEDMEAGTLVDKLMVKDTVQGPDDQTLLEVVPSEDGEGHAKVAIDEDNLREAIDNIHNSIDNIIETIDEMDVDSVPRAYLASTLNQSPGDNVSTRTAIDVFSVTAIEGDCFEFEQTTTIDDTPFGYVWIEPGTYLINAAVTLQWVGNPRGTFIAKVGSVMGENFDFSQEQEIKRNTTKVVTIPNRMKLAVNVTYDAGTPVMGFWIQSVQVVKLAGGMSQTNIIHDDTLAGQGSVADPLGVDEEKIAQSTLAGNLAPAFDPTRPNTNPYHAGESVVHDGEMATFAVDHYGAWNDADVMYTGESAFEALMRLTALSVIENVVKYSDFVQGFVNQHADLLYFPNRKRSRFIYASGGYVILVCPGYDVRLTFFNSNAISHSYLVDENNPVNQNWQNGDCGIKVKVPNGAINFVISVRRRDNADFEVDENPVVSYGLVNQELLIRKSIYENKFIDSNNSVMTYPVKKIQSEGHIAYLVKVHIPSWYKARIIYSTYPMSFSQNSTALEWHTSSYCARIYDIATFYTVQFMKIDESDITDNSYRECSVEIAANSAANCIVSILGDSISTFGGSTSDPNNARYAVAGDPTYQGNRCRYPQTNLGLNDSEVDFTYWMRLIHAFGAKLGISESWAGSRISNTQATDSGDFGPNRCIASQTRIDHLGVNGTPDLILVYGGTNDAGGNVTIGTFNTESPANYSQAQIDALPVDTFANACRAMMIRLQKTYPNAKVVVILPNYVTSYYSPERLDPYCEMLKTVCDYFGVQYVDVRTSGISMFNASSFLADGIHPNKNGMLLLANCIARSGTIARDII